MENIRNLYKIKMKITLNKTLYRLHLMNVKKKYFFLWLLIVLILITKYYNSIFLQSIFIIIFISYLRFVLSILEKKNKKPLKK